MNILIPIHLLDQFNSKVRESVVKRREWFEYAPRIDERVMVGVYECHMANTMGVILSKDGERIA